MKTKDIKNLLIALEEEIVLNESEISRALFWTSGSREKRQS